MPSSSQRATGVQPPTFLQPIGRLRAFEEVLEQLEQAIADGHLGAGDRLPPERQLAAALGVSRTSVREALRVLEALGLVGVKRGAENGVTLLEEPGNMLAHLFRFHLALQHLRVESLVEFRVAVESWAAGAFARHGDPAVLAQLDALVRGMETERLDPLQFHERDVAFHLTLARGSGNELASLVLEGCRAAIQRAMLDAFGRAGDWPRTRRRLVREHRAILDAVARADPEAAASLVASHVMEFYESHLASPIDQP
jgi:GntR family transcriptional repressor for pyruvate dehydrogenase complex